MTFAFVELMQSFLLQNAISRNDYCVGGILLSGWDCEAIFKGIVPFLLTTEYITSQGVCFACIYLCNKLYVTNIQLLRILYLVLIYISRIFGLDIASAKMLLLSFV